MCGIAGLLNFDRRRLATEAATALIGRMNKSQVHRGPDAEGAWVDRDGYCHLGHRRLSIIDLAASANQPMMGAQGRYVVVFNGEIYNYKVLRAELEARGVVFRTQSDTEVLIEAFAAYGHDAFTRCDGQFAVAIFDTTTKRLVLARDRAGEKPLYFTARPGLFAFASELRALLELPGPSPVLSEQSLALYMALRYVPAPGTIFEGIHKLEPGSVLEVGPDGEMRKGRYFTFEIDDAAAAKPQDIAQFADEVEDALEESLRDRLNSDVPLGAFLSRGIDSSLACAILAKRMNRPVKSFTIGFEGDERSEHVAAADIAAHLGIEHRSFVFGASDFDRTSAECGRLLDEPNGDHSCIPVYLLSQLAREEVTVAISGDAGDELYAGYGRYMVFMQQNKERAWHGGGDIAAAYLETMLPVYPWAAIRETLPGGMGAVTAFADSMGGVFARHGRTMLNAVRLLDFQSYLPGQVLAKVDRMSMRHGLEVRTPYLSPRMLALSSRATSTACVDQSGQKAVLRRILGKYLPPVHALAPKQGFGMPRSVFVNNADRIKSELGAAFGVLSATSFFQARPGKAEVFVKSAVNNANAIWSTMVLSRWIESLGFRV